MPRLRSRMLFCSAVLGSLATAAPAGADEAALSRRAAAIRPAAEQRHFLEIPWRVDPDAALALAREERRPLFLWAAGGRDRDGEPLERC